MDINYINDKLIEIKELLTKIQNEISSNGKDQEKLQELWGKAYAMLCEYIDLIQIVNRLDFTKMNSRLEEIKNEFESLSNFKEEEKEIENNDVINEVAENVPSEETIEEAPVIEDAPIEENVEETPVIEETPVEENVVETPIEINIPEEKEEQIVNEVSSDEVINTPVESAVVTPIVEEGTNESEIRVVNKADSPLANKRISVSAHQGTNLYNSASEQSKIIDELYNNKEEKPKEETDKEAMWAEVQQLYSEGKTTEAEEISNKIMSLNKPNYQTAA